MGDGHGRRNIEFGQLTCKKWVLRKLIDELLKLCSGQVWLFLAQGRQRQHDLREQPEIMAALGGEFELLDAYFLVAVDSSEAEEELLDFRQTSDSEVRT